MSIENKAENWTMLTWTQKNLAESVVVWKDEPELTPLQHMVQPLRAPVLYFVKGA